MQSKNKQKFIFICSAKSCKKNGSDELKQTLKDFIKSEGLKNDVRIIKTKCMDFCKAGPNVVADNQLYHKVTVEEAKAILHDMLANAPS